MFQLNPENYYVSSALAHFRHGFGTRARSLMDLQPMTTLRQIHSANTVEAAETSGCIGEGDALVSRRLPVGVKTADCVPILIADPQSGAVAAVHAGWRGTVAGVAAAAVTNLAGRFGSRTEDLILALGPSIGPCCFEVGPEVAVEFRHLFPERRDLDTRTFVDLPEANLRILERQGISRSQVDVARLCTRCSGDAFHSYRRDRDQSGRMLSFIAP